MKTKLPPNMTTRKWKNKKGVTTTAYYHRSSRETGRVLTALGTDYKAALATWASIEGAKLESDAGTLADVYQRYMAWVKSQKDKPISARTEKDREAYWGAQNGGKLNQVFGHIHMDNIKPEWMLQYFEGRSSQISAKKELKFLSVLCNWAKARGLMTANNPTTGIMRLLKINEKRDIYVEDSWYQRVLKHASPMVRDVMTFTYLCANRPDETAQARFSDIDGTELVISLAKTEKKGLAEKRVPIEGELRAYIERQKHKPVRSMFLVSDARGQQVKINGSKFKLEFKRARDAAQAEAEAAGEAFTRFQLKDLRAKAGTDIARQYGIEAARLALGHTTQKQTQDYIRSVNNAAINARARG